MSICIENFVGTWESSNRHTNPIEDKGNEYPTNWKNRVDYYPPDGLIIKAEKKRSQKTFEVMSNPGNPESPVARDIIKFTFENRDEVPGYSDELVRVIQEAEYHCFGGFLISTPLVITQDLILTEVIKLIQNYDIPNKGLTDIMRHQLLWKDGLLAMWPCCRV